MLTNAGENTCQKLKSGIYGETRPLKHRQSFYLKNQTYLLQFFYVFTRFPDDGTDPRMSIKQINSSIALLVKF